MRGGGPRLGKRRRRRKDADVIQLYYILLFNIRRHWREEKKKKKQQLINVSMNFDNYDRTTTSCRVRRGKRDGKKLVPQSSS